jgi:hypothetical protein
MTTIGITGLGLTGVVRMNWVQDGLAHVLEHAHTDETSGTWTGRACPEYGLPLGSDVDGTMLRRLAGEGEFADLTWEAPDDIAADHSQMFQAAISGYQAAEPGPAEELWEQVQAIWSHAWSANYAVLEFLQDTGLSRFSPIKPQRWMVASFEHHCGPHGMPRPHIHNIVIAALTKGLYPPNLPVWQRVRAAGIAYDDVRPRENGAAVAQKVQTLFVDDIDGSAADGTVRFGLDGTDYEIDLNSENAQALRDALARYVTAARRVGGGTRRQVRSGRKAPANGVNTTEIREWAKAQGIEVKDRGRVPAELVARFKAAAGQ